MLTTVAVACAGVSVTLSEIARSDGALPSFAASFALSANPSSDLADDFSPRLAAGDDGTWIAVWQSRGTLGADFDIFVSRSSDAGTSWTAPAPLHANAASDTGDDTQPAIATDGAGRFVVAWRSNESGFGLGTESDLLVVRSIDSGTTWTTPVALNGDAATDLEMDVEPCVATDGAGTWLAAWASHDPAQTATLDFDILVARSVNVGASWSAPAPLHASAASDARSDGVPRLAHDGAGTWLAVWQMDDPGGAVETDEDVAVSRSTDGGLSWTAPALLNPDDGDGDRDDRDPQIATNGAGTWLALWESNDPTPSLDEDFDILMARSTNGGATWSAPAPVNGDASVDAGADLDPQIASDGAGGWVALWQSSNPAADLDNRFRPRIARSVDAGSTWTPPESAVPEMVGASEGDFDPQVAADGAGRFVVVYYQASPDGDDTDVRVARGSSPFGPASALHATAAGDVDDDGLPSVAIVASGHAVALWQASAPGGALGSDLDLLVARSGDGGASWTAPTPLYSGSRTESAPDLLPRVASNGTGTWVAVWQASGGTFGSDADILISRSTNQGSSWTAPAALYAGALGDAALDQRPQIASDGAAGFVVVWQTRSGAFGSDFDVLEVHSSNAGATWSAPAPLESNAASDSTPDFGPQVASNGPGSWLAAWMTLDAAAGLGSDIDLLFARSSNGGAQWTAPALLDTDAASDARSDLAPQLASDGAGSWVAVWQASGGTLGNDNDVLVTRSSNGGATWSAPAALVADASTDTRVDQLPSISTDGAGTWLALWEADQPGGPLGSDTDLLFARSSDAGASWSAPAALDPRAAFDAGSDARAQIASDRRGGWLAAWSSTDPQGGSLGTDADVLFARSLGPDTDGDGLADAAELRVHGTNPALRDSEGDGLGDGDEIRIHGTDPFALDSDGDQLGDLAEVAVHGANPLSQDGDADQVGDFSEVTIYGTNPMNADSDGDTLGDAAEIFVHATDPLDRDSDGDSFDDGDELAAGSDPLDPLSFPAGPPSVPALGIGARLLIGLGLLLAAHGALRRRTRATGAALGAAVGLLLADAARAIDPALCADDGVTEVPAFAPLGRDANQCLRIDPGNGNPPVPFQYEVFHRKGISRSAASQGQNPATDVIDLRATAWDKCSTKGAGQYCSFLIWDVVLDNYLDPATEGEDVWFVGLGESMQYLLVKDTRFYNGWKCQGGGGWNGPNGLGCAPGEDSDAHSDGIQLRGQPVNGGWAVFQDSELVNGHIALFLAQGSPTYGAFGSLAFQGFRIEQSNLPTGAAASWIDDCLARGSAASTCYRNRAQIDYAAQELWLIDVWGNTRFSSFGGSIGKLVIVNTGCGATGCQGRVGYNNGWPHPLTKSSDAGPGTCPNGPLVAVSPWPGMPSIYCYTSLEQAALQHELPPFVQLSPSGWQNPPSP